MVEDEGERLPARQDPRALRVSDAERDHVIGVLQKAVGRGLVTLEEFSSRTDTALAATTRAELNRVLIDLPEIRYSDSMPAGEPVASGEPLVLRTGAGTVRQHGHWTVPGTITAECGMGTISIDFTTAVCQRREITLHATCGAGTITVIVPRGWTVVMVQAISRMGDVVNKATDAPDAAMPVLRVYAKVGMGTVKIRYPRGRTARK